MTDTEIKRLQAICEVANVDDIEDLSDGFHTFNDLYEQRMYLFAALVKTHKDKAWKSMRHEDGEMCFGGDWFIVGIDTPTGSYTYHYGIKYWDVFDCQILKTAKHWDGHTEKDVTRLLSLPSVQPNLQPTCNNLVTDTISRQDAIDLAYDCEDEFGKDVAFRFAYYLRQLPSAQPANADCWGCNCQKMERSKEKKTFSEMVHLHDAETHEERTETHACDLISRQALMKEFSDFVRASNNSDFARTPTWNDAVSLVGSMPSAQPESTRTFVELVVEYPDPELCTYKEYKGKPYYSIKYIKNGETHVGYGTYNPEVISQYLKEYFISSAQPEPHWIPFSERLPESKTAYYIVTLESRDRCVLPNDIDIARWDYDRRKGKDSWHWCKERKVIAWKPLPKPYMERRTNGVQNE